MLVRIVTLCIDLFRDFIHDFNTHDTFVEEYHPKTYGTRIRR